MSNASPLQAVRISTAPADPLSLTTGEMCDLLQTALTDNDCYFGGSFGPDHADTVDLGPFVWLYITPSDPCYGVLFDSRTGEMVLTISGDYLGIERRCTPPDPLDVLDTGFAAATPPEGCYRYCDHDPCSESACPEEIVELNEWGAEWSRQGCGCWFDRTYEEVWELVSHTAFVNAFAACGPYEMFVRGLTTPGGAHCVDTDDARMIFVLAGNVDVSVCPP